MKETVIILVFLLPVLLIAQPEMGENGVKFKYHAPDADAVYLAGEFNGWAPTGNPMEKADDGWWILEYPLKPGSYQYKFVVNGSDWKSDPDNPHIVDDNFGGANTVITVTDDGKVVLGEIKKAFVATDDYAVDGRLYLNIIWHQHQPLYLDPIGDYLRGPWVRAHATKDYYDMAATIGKYPDLHITINLTSVLLLQLQEYYVKRLEPYVDVKKNRVDAGKYFAEMSGKTDPWIDIALKPTGEFTHEDDAYLYKNTWNSFGISDVMLDRFPEYRKLKDKGDGFSEQEKREIKLWHYLAWFDPDFLRGKVELPTDVNCDLSDLIEERSNGKFYLRKTITEDDCNRIIAETYKVCSACVPMHRELMYDPEKHTGQLEIITTPYYHPILPLLYSSNTAKTCQPGQPLPTEFAYPGDANAQVAKAVKYYEELFGKKPDGFWPAEGSVSEAIVSIMVDNGVKWMATGDGVLYRSTPANQPVYFPYRVDSDKSIGGDPKQAMAVVFRNTELSDKIGFKYQLKSGEEAADDFIRSVIKFASPNEDRMLTVILDGENAWEWYRMDNDGKEFLNAMYRKFSKLQKEGSIITVTTSEYLMGNPKRSIPAHPVARLRELEPLWPGSWINANYDTWIAETEENTAWEYLLTVRKDLEKFGINPPDPRADPPAEGGKDYWVYKAWEELYAAEGSDWFWWYGGDQGAPGGDEPFDEAFIAHLNGVYEFMNKAGYDIVKPVFAPIIRGASSGGGGAMAISSKKIQVTFMVDAGAQNITDAIFIVGDRNEIGNWTPNKIKMFDDGTHGDEKADDGIWSLEIEFLENITVQYKFTNSGKEGEWIPGEEFPMDNRQIFIRDDGGGKMVVKNKFGEM